MEGFFDSQETAAAAVVRSIKGCGACGLKNGCKTPKMRPQGTGANGIMLLAESPNAAEDKTGGQQTGDKLLRRILARHGVKLLECKKVYAVRCRPAGGESPTDEQIDYCRPDVWKEIEAMKPKVIIALGVKALASIISHRTEKGLGAINKWRGWQIPDRETGCWVLPVMSPADVASNAEKNFAYETIFDQDIKRAVNATKDIFPKFKDEKELVEIIDNERDVVRLLRDLCRNEFEEITFDYEASGLKPYAEGHFIYTASVKAATRDMAYAWMWPEDPDSSIFRWWCKLMLGPSIKIAQNCKYEDLWTNVILGHPVRNWHHDTMLVSHILDNRPDITGLKFQSYVNFGLLGYDEAVSKYLKSSDEDEKLYGANAFNKIRNANKKDILLYNGIDSLVEEMLFKVQQKQVEKRAHEPKHL